MFNIKPHSFIWSAQTCIMLTTFIADVITLYMLIPVLSYSLCGARLWLPVLRAMVCLSSTRVCSWHSHWPRTHIRPQGRHIHACTLYCRSRHRARGCPALMSRIVTTQSANLELISMYKVLGGGTMKRLSLSWCPELAASFGGYSVQMEKAS